jgi:hypothetical protein
MLLSAIDHGDLDRVRELVRAGASTKLYDAARILRLVRRCEPHNYERAAVRWFGRYASEREARLGLEALGRALDALACCGLSLTTTRWRDSCHDRRPR